MIAWKIADTTEIGTGIWTVSATKAMKTKKLNIKSHQFHGPDGDGNMPNKTK